MAARTRANGDHSPHLPVLTGARRKIRMTTYQKTNAVAGSTQEVMNVRYTAKTHTSGGRRGVASRRLIHDFYLGATKEKNMIPSQAYRTALIAIAGFLLTPMFYSGSVAQTKSPQGVRNIVIVHGAWADGSSWSKVIPLLQAKGFHVVAVQNPLTSLADDVAATKRAI